MQVTSLHGPYRLLFDEIDCEIRRKSAGTFALGYVDNDGNFRIRYVGRSDDDIKNRLRLMIGSDQYFKFAYAATPAAAFERECDLFHNFRPFANMLHPERPNGSSLECQRCKLGGNFR